MRLVVHTPPAYPVSRVLIRNRGDWVPCRALPFWMAWRSDPCTVRAAAWSSPSPVRVTTLKENPKSRPVRERPGAGAPPMISMRAMCSREAKEALPSEIIQCRPPYNSPGSWWNHQAPSR